MSHDYHEGLSGYDPAQILHDGCQECEWRGEHVDLAIGYLDPQNFDRACRRAVDWQRHGTAHAISRAEADLLRVLWAVTVQQERTGVIA